MNSDYVLITPARNEEALVEKTIHSVLSQTRLPKKWVVVSDGSTDRTDDIVDRYEGDNSLLKLLRIERRGQRDFGGKVAAFNAGYKELAATTYQFIGNLDADVSFAEDYFERLLDEFNTHLALGIGGGLIFELVAGEYVPQDISLNSVAGAVQLFRRTCFEAIGGYPHLPGGGIDSAAEIMARTKGWEVRTVPGLRVLHHRRVTIGTSHIWKTRFRQGVNNYVLGYHALFQLASSVYRMRRKPYIWGGALSLLGYCWAGLSGRQILMPREAVAHLRSEQLARLRRALANSSPTD